MSETPAPKGEPLTPDREARLREIHAGGYSVETLPDINEFLREWWECTREVLAEIDRLRDMTEQAKAVIQSWPCECSDEHHCARCKHAEPLWSILETHPGG